MKFFISGILLIFFVSCKSTAKIRFEKEEIDAKRMYDSLQVQGCFLLFDLEENSCKVYNKLLIDSAYTPASTYKIPNSIIALETDVMKDLDHVIPWDSVIRQNAKWNLDTDLRSAYKNSTVWFYQEVARRIGEERMKKWIEKLDYGNKNINGGIDKFWLTGDLRITPRQQMEFLEKLIKEDLPVSDSTYLLMKEIMIYEKTDNYVLRAKTGWGNQNNRDIGWFVGYVTRDNKEYIFVNLVLNDDPENKNFIPSRAGISYEILKKVGLIDP